MFFSAPILIKIFFHTFYKRCKGKYEIFPKKSSSEGISDRILFNNVNVHVYNFVNMQFVMYPICCITTNTISITNCSFISGKWKISWKIAMTIALFRVVWMGHHISIVVNFSRQIKSLRDYFTCEYHICEQPFYHIVIMINIQTSYYFTTLSKHNLSIRVLLFYHKEKKISMMYIFNKYKL